MKNLTFTLALSFGILAPLSTFAAEALPTQTIIVESPPCALPTKETTSIDLMQRAASCLEAKQMHEAVVVYFAGQIRLRTLAIVEKDANGAPAMLSSVTYALGPAVNGWAGGDITGWMVALADAIDWDKKTPFSELNAIALKNFRNVVEAQAIHEKVRASIYTLIGRLRDDRAKIYLRRNEQNHVVRDPWWTTEQKSIAKKAAMSPPTNEEVREIQAQKKLKESFEAGGLSILGKKAEKGEAAQ